MTKPEDPSKTIRVVLILLLGMLLTVALCGVGMIIWGGYSAYRGWDSSSWPAAEGVIESVDVVQDFDPGGGVGETRTSATWNYRAIVRYRYAVAGRDYVGDRIQFMDAATSNRSRAEAVAAAHPVGHRVQVHYDPNAPERAVLKRGASRNSLLLILAGVLFIVVPLFALGIPVWRALKRYSDDDRSATDDNQDDATSDQPPPRSRVQLLEESPECLVFVLPPGRTAVQTTGWTGVILLGLGGFFAAFFLPDMFDQYARPSAQEILVAAIFAVASLGGLAVLVWWFKLKFTRHQLDVTRSQAVVERRFFSAVRRTAIPFKMETRAVLVLDHEDMGEPIEAISFAPAGKHVRLGVTLSPPEKRWVVDRVNAFLAETT